MHNDMPPDEDLVRLARAGDRSAFGDLYERHRHFLASMLRRAAGESAADLVHESFAAAYLLLPQLRQPESFRSWLCGIGLNLCRQYLKSESRRERRHAGLYGGLYDPGASTTPEEIFEARQRDRAIRSALEGLSPSLRTSVLLHYFDFLSVREIASLLGISESAVKTRLSRARSALRPKLLALAAPITLTEEAMVKLDVLDVVGGNQILLLDRDSHRVLSIFVDSEQARSIALSVGGVSPPRPLTFMLLASLLSAAGARLRHVCVKALRGTTYIAAVALESGQEVDARPSDAINLALTLNIPIYADEAVLDQVAVALPEEARELVFEPKGVKSIISDLQRQGALRTTTENLADYVMSLAAR